MGLFGGKGDKDAENERIRATHARLAPLPLPELAGEVLQAAFGSGSPADGGPLTMPFLQQAVSGSDSVFGVDLELRQELDLITQEGVQALEHAGLVVATFSGGQTAGQSWRPTRAGAAALQAGDAVARVRARIGG